MYILCRTFDGNFIFPAVCSLKKRPKTTTLQYLCGNEELLTNFSR